MPDKEKVIFSSEKENKKELIFDPKETILKSAEIDGEPTRVQGSNVVFKIKFAGPKPISAIFKPADGENIFPDHSYYKPGDYYKRERAAYLVDRFFGFNLIPPTVIREINNRVGSLQEHIPNHRAGWQVNSLFDLVAINESDFVKMAVLDFIIWNADRNMTNIFIINKDKQERLLAIDNSLSFGESGIFNAAGMDKLVCLDQIPEEIVFKIEQAFANGEVMEVFRNMLSELLSPEEIDKFFDRLERVMHKKRITNEDVDDFSY